MKIVKKKDILRVLLIIIVRSCSKKIGRRVFYYQGHSPVDLHILFISFSIPPIEIYFVILLNIVRVLLNCPVENS